MTFAKKKEEAMLAEIAMRFSRRKSTIFRGIAGSNGDRVLAGGWPKITGTPGARNKQSIREIDKVLLSHGVLLTFRDDKKFGP